MLSQEVEVKKSDMEKVLEKIRSFQDIPSYDELVTFIEFVETNWYDKLDEALEQKKSSFEYDWYETTWSTICSKHRQYQVLNSDFVYRLADELEAHKQPIVELCAGNGKLSYHLRKRGINIIPTDDFSWTMKRERFVERLSYDDAIRKYQPETALVSWCPNETSLRGMLDSGIRNLFYIGEEIGGSTGLTNNVISKYSFDYRFNIHPLIGMKGINISDFMADYNHTLVASFEKRY